MDTFSKPLITVYQKCAITRDFGRVSEGTRTPDRLDHNQIEWVRITRVCWDLQGLLVLSSSQFCSR